MPTSHQHPDLILYNARTITLSQSQPAAELVGIRGDRIAWLGSNEALGGLVGPDTRLIDCQGQTLVPGFIDAHCHLMAYAASLLAVDCSPAAVASIAQIQQALRQRGLTTPAGQWIRGAGYDDFALRERRHPSRRDLDAAAPEHPVRLNHRSGHACVLNSMALARVGISADAPDPMGGVIERDPSSGEPTGLLMEMDDYLEGRVPPMGEEELRRGVRQASQNLASLGVTSIQDATPSNSTQRWHALHRLKAEGDISQRVTMMVGSGHLEEFNGVGLPFGSGDANLNLGAVKVMLSTTTGSLHPPVEELRARIIQARQAGFPVAVHAVEAEAVEAAADALMHAKRRPSITRSPGRDRVEHCSECPPATLAKLAGLGAMVVTQPGFLYHSGQRYLSEVARDVQPWLYRVNSFLAAGLRPAFGSDAPVIEPNPLVGMYAAVTRRARAGATLGESERVPPLEALRMYTLNGAFAASQEADKGSVEVGKLADLAVLDHDPAGGEAEQLLQTRVALTVIGGQVVWQT